MNRFSNITVALAIVLFVPSCGNGHGESASHEHEEVHEHEMHHEEHDHDGHDHDMHDHESVHDAHDHEGQHSHEGENHKDIIEFSHEKAEAAGLRTETVAPGPFSGVIRVSGEILPAQGDEVTLSSTASGIVSFSGTSSRGASQRIVPGVNVREGSTLMWISSREMPEGEQAMKAQAAYEAAAKEYERASSLVESGAISRKAFEQAELAYTNARTEYEAYKGKYSENGVAVKSRISGHVKQCFVSEGDYVSAGQALAVITQNRFLQLRADVPERYYSRIASVSGANFRPSYSSETYSVETLGGRKLSSGRAAAQGSFFIPVTFEFRNAGDIVPGSYADIWLVDSREDNVISVPETALTEEQGVHFVYIRLCEEEYRKQEVRTGRTDGIRREIISGLNAGDEVVTEGVFQVRLASVSGVVPEGHSHNH